MLITDHHPGFIDWETYQANQARINANTRPAAHQLDTGRLREGVALLQGPATCGVCGRKLAVYYDGPHKATPGCCFTGTGQLVEGRDVRHLRIGGGAVDAEASLVALAQPPSTSGDARLNAPATPTAWPNAATVPSTWTTGS